MSETEKQAAAGGRDASSGAPQKHSLEPTREATRRTVAIVIVLLLVAVVVAIIGILPRMHARAALRKETDSMAVPDVAVVTPQMGEPMQEVLLPGTIQALCADEWLREGVVPRHWRARTQGRAAGRD